MSWRREWQPTPAYLPREFPGHRSVVGLGPRGCKESDTTEWLSLIHSQFSGIDHLYWDSCLWAKYNKYSGRSRNKAREACRVDAFFLEWGLGRLWWRASIRVGCWSSVGFYFRWSWWQRLSTRELCGQRCERVWRAWNNPISPRWMC